MKKNKKFNPGEVVAIRQDLIVGQKYGGREFTEEMDIHSFVIINSVNADGSYDSVGHYNCDKHCNDHLTWTDEMFKPLPKEKITIDDVIYYAKQALLAFMIVGFTTNIVLMLIWFFTDLI